MRGRDVLEVLGGALAVTASAEGARQLLTPRRRLPAPLPVDLADHFSQTEIERGRAFARPQRRLATAGSALEATLLAALVARPPAVLRRADASPRLGGAAVAAGLSVGLSLPGLPLRALARRRSLAAGLATGSWGAWAADLGKASGLQAGLSGALGAGAIALSGRSPRRWWLPAAGVTVAGAALAGALAPVLLEPLFNDFEPLGEGETRSDVLALAADAGVSVRDVYSVDASRRTTAANAYVSGLGPTKRVVVFDTMLDRYSRDEVRLVVAHELGHVAHRDVLRNLTFAALISPALTWAIQRAGAALAGTAPDAPLTPSALPALALASALVSAPLGPGLGALSRAMERAADRFSLELAGAPEAFVSFERRAAVQNLADLKPGRLQRWTASHPPADERIGAALQFAASRAGV